MHLQQQQLQNISLFQMDRVLKMTPYPKLYEENYSLHLIRYFDLITYKYFQNNEPWY